MTQHAENPQASHARYRSTTMAIYRTRALFYVHALSAGALMWVVVDITPTAMPDYLCKLLAVAGLNVVGMVLTKRDLVRLEGTTWWRYRSRVRPENA